MVDDVAAWHGPILDLNNHQWHASETFVFCHWSFNSSMIRDFSCFMEPIHRPTDDTKGRSMTVFYSDKVLKRFGQHRAPANSPHPLFPSPVAPPHVLESNWPFWCRSQNPPWRAEKPRCTQYRGFDEKTHTFLGGQTCCWTYISTYNL